MWERVCERKGGIGARSGVAYSETEVGFDSLFRHLCVFLHCDPTNLSTALSGLERPRVVPPPLHKVARCDATVFDLHAGRKCRSFSHHSSASVLVPSRFRGATFVAAARSATRPAEYDQGVPGKAIGNRHGAALLPARLGHMASCG